jgi:signal transduction histidine kinase
MSRRLFAWPKSLFGRLILILICGLTAAHALSFALALIERRHTTALMMINYLSRDIASSVAILDRLPAPEREEWLPKLERRNYRYTLEPPVGLHEAEQGLARRIAAVIQKAVGPQYDTRVFVPPNDQDQLLIQLHLHDGNPLGIEVAVTPLPLARWVLVVLGAQLLLLFIFSWKAVRTVTRPLMDLADAANSLGGSNLKSVNLSEKGPVEVAHAAGAFNAMQRRIADYVTERMQILAAISHDLQTPITRMRLRADLLDDAALRDKLYGDLDSMQALVQEVIAYVRDGQGLTEAPRRIDLDALLDSLVCDYVDADKQVSLIGRVGRAVCTRPQTVKRIVANLVDNALKFAQSAEVHVAVEEDWISMTVVDRGPGIPESELETVLNPFYRVESSRNRETGGTGLGLAIANQLSHALGGALTLNNREGGGLSARVRVPHVQSETSSPALVSAA